MIRKNIILLLTLLIAAALLMNTLPALAAGPEDETQGGEPSAEEPATAAPAAEETSAPQTPTPAPTAPPATEAPATAAPTEAPGTVNLHLYVYTASDAPAGGYTVQVGSSRTTTGADGLANFSGLPVAQQTVAITSPDGQTCQGKLYMARASSTRITDQAMGGTYGVDIARGQNELYLLTTFEPDGALLIRSATNSQPALPAPAPTEAPVSQEAPAAVALTATFLDPDGKGIAGMPIAAAPDASQSLEGSTDAAGQISLPAVPLGHYTVTAQVPGAAADSFDLTLQPSAVTGIAGNVGKNMTVNVSAAATHLYLQFDYTSAGFVLSAASQSPISSGGTNSMLIGMIAVAVIIIAAIILITVLRRRKKRAAAAPAASSGTYVPQRKINYDPNAERLKTADDRPKRTGGANKFDDRSKL